MESYPLISGLMVSRNNAAYVGAAIDSVLSQSYASWELIIIENASSDGSWEIARHAASKDARIKITRLHQEICLPKARNLALARAAGKYVATIDADDIWLRSRILSQVEYMERRGHEDVGVCGTNCLLIGEDGGLLGTKRFPQTHEECFAALWYRNPFCHSATLVRRSALESFGGSDATFDVAQDWELCFRRGPGIRFRNLPDYIVK
jgi:glycosyltransferase involved in cell wall biosynthesis